MNQTASGMTTGQPKNLPQKVQTRIFKRNPFLLQADASETCNGGAMMPDMSQDAQPKKVAILVHSVTVTENDEAHQQQ